MTATDLPVRVMVQDAWIDLPILASSATTFAELKLSALQAAQVVRPAAEYAIKRNGALVTDEAQSLGTAGVKPNAPFIVLPIRRRAVK